MNYKLNGKEKLGLFLTCLFALFGLGFLFYNTLFTGVMVIPVYLLMKKVYVKYQLKKKQQKLCEEFIDFLRSVEASVATGASLENSFRQAQRELASIHGEDSFFYGELQEINRRVAMNESIEKVFLEFAQTATVPEIESFAEVLQAAKRSGNNLVTIMEGTTYRLTLAMETEKEIAVMVSGRIYEQRIMNFMPLFLLAYLRIGFGEYLKILYGNIAGILFMTVCLFLYGIAVLWSQKLLTVHV